MSVRKEEAIQIGEERGREEVIKIGAEKGREEGKKAEKIEFAKKLLKTNMSIDFISEITGLSANEIKHLQEESTL